MVERIANKKAKLFADNESVITDFEIYNPKLHPNTINAHFAKASDFAGYGYAFEEVGCHLFEALEAIGYRPDHETGGNINVSSIEELKAKCATHNAIILTYDDVKKRLQDNGYITDDEKDLSKNGWLDQLEQTLNPNLNAWHDENEPVYDFNNMPNSIKNSQEAACIYACSGIYNTVVQNTQILENPEIVAGIIDCITCDSNKFQNIWKHVPASIKTNANIVKSSIAYKCKFHDILIDLNAHPDLLTQPDIVEALAQYNQINNYPSLLNNPSMEKPILAGLLKWVKAPTSMSESDIDNMTTDELIGNIKPYLGGWLITTDSIPSNLFYNDEILIATGAIDKIPPHKQNDKDLILKIYQNHPGLIKCNNRLDLLENNHDLMLAYIKAHHVGVYDDDIIACADIINRNGYMAYADIKAALVERGLYSLKHEPGCNDKNLAITAILHDNEEYKYISDSLKSDKDILKTVMIDKHIGEWFCYVPPVATPIIEDLIDKTHGLYHNSVTWSTLPKHLMTPKILSYLLHLTYHAFDSVISQKFRLTNMTRPVNITAEIIANTMKLEKDLPVLNDELIFDTKSLYPQFMANDAIREEIHRRNNYQSEINNEVQAGHLNKLLKRDLIAI